MRLDDPSTWTAHAFAILGIAAIVPFDLANQRLFWRMLLLAVVIAAVNWIIGSMWIVPLSELAIPRGESEILARKRAPYKFRLSASSLTVVLWLVATTSTILLLVVDFFRFSMRGGFVLRSLVALIGVLLVPRVIKRTLRIKRFGKALFVILLLLLTSAIVVLYLVWIG